MSQRENFYKLLGLHHSVTDAETIRKTIDRKERGWVNKSVGDLIAKANHALVPEIRKAMESPESREREARDYLSALLRELTAQLELRADAQRSVSDEDVAELVKKFKGKFPDQDRLKEEEIRLQIPQLGYVIREGTSRRDVVKEKVFVDPVKFEMILRDLRVARHKDLYEFLGLPSPNFSHPEASGPPLVQLLKTAEERSTEARRRGTSAEWSAKGRLAGHCRDLFRYETSRESYNNSLERHNLDQIFGEAWDIFIRDGRIGSDELQKLFKIGAMHGVSQERTLAYVHEKLHDQSGPSKKGDELVRQADEALAKNNLALAEKLVSQLRGMDPNRSAVKELEQRIQRRREQIRLTETLKRQIESGDPEREILETAEKLGSLIDKPMDQATSNRVGKAKDRIALFDRFKRLPSTFDQDSDELFAKEWNDSEAEALLIGTNDPEANKLVDTRQDIAIRLNKLEQLEKVIDAVEDSQDAETSIAFKADMLDRGYSYRLEPRVKLARILSDASPLEEQIAEVWQELNDKGLTVKNEKLRARCEAAAKRHTANSVLPPNFGISDEEHDRQFVLAWKRFEFQVGDVDEEYFKWWRGARERVATLDKIRDAVAGLKDEQAIVLAAVGLDEGYSFEQAPRVDLARALTESPSREALIAELWEKLANTPHEPKTVETKQRCEKAALRVDALRRLPKIPVGNEERFDREFLSIWNESDLASVPEAASLEPSFRTANGNVARLDQLARQADRSDLALAGELQLAEIGAEFPIDYEYVLQPRVSLAQALSKVPQWETDIAAQWERIENTPQCPRSPETIERCRIAVRRRDALRAIREKSDKQSDEYDAAFRAHWNDELFKGCSEADALREDAQRAVKRSNAFKDLEKALNEGNDPRHVKRLAANPLLGDYPLRIARQAEITRHLERAKVVEQLVTAVENEDHAKFRAVFDPKWITENPQLLTFYWDELGDFITAWWRDNVSLEAGDPPFTMTPDGKSVNVMWTHRDNGQAVHFEVAVRSDAFLAHLEDAADQTQRRTVEDKARRGGGVLISAPASGQKSYVTIWAVSSLGTVPVISNPLHIGPITARRVEPSCGTDPRKSSWRWSRVLRNWLNR